MKLNLEFHAIQDEIIKEIKCAVIEHNLFLVSIQLFPIFSCELISVEMFEEKTNVIQNSRMILLYNYKPNLLMKDYNEFIKNNGDCLIFEIGVQNDNSLKESSIATITNNKETLKLWKNIMKKFKSNMYKGAWVINSKSGQKAYYKNHYYTLSAKNAFERGMKMLPYTGWSIYILNEKA